MFVAWRQLNAEEKTSAALSRERNSTSTFAYEIRAHASISQQQPTPSNCLKLVSLGVNHELNLRPKPSSRENLLAPELEARSQRQAPLQYPENSE